MNIDEVLALYDKEMRRELPAYQGRREVLPELVRHVYDDPNRKGVIIYNQVTEANVEAVMEREIAYFKALGRPFEWNTFEHDPIPDLHLRLAARGFEVEEEEDAVMVLDLAAPPAKLLEPITADVRRITDPANIDDVMAVEEVVWNTEFSWLKARLINDLAVRPDEIAIYVAYVDGKPASSGWIYYHTNTHFASLWGGSTLEAYRKRGLYTALVASRLQDALQQGFRYLTIDAGYMSRPIVAGYGFELLTLGHECDMKPETD